MHPQNPKPDAEQLRSLPKLWALPKKLLWGLWVNSKPPSFLVAVEAGLRQTGRRPRLQHGLQRAQVCIQQACRRLEGPGATSKVSLVRISPFSPYILASSYSLPRVTRQELFTTTQPS